MTGMSEDMAEQQQAAQLLLREQDIRTVVDDYMANRFVLWQDVPREERPAYMNTLQDCHWLLGQLQAERRGNRELRNCG